MCTHWVAVPFWDEWETPGAQLADYCQGSLDWADLFGQHNEHRLFFPRLIWLPLAILAGSHATIAMLLERDAEAYLAPLGVSFLMVAQDGSLTVRDAGGASPAFVVSCAR